jgi:hypothetical protein
LTDLSDLLDLIVTVTSALGKFVMVKERITAKSLAEMITAKIGASGLEIVVREVMPTGGNPMLLPRQAT